VKAKSSLSNEPNQLLGIVVSGNQIYLLNLKQTHFAFVSLRGKKFGKSENISLGNPLQLNAKNILTRLQLTASFIHVFRKYFDCLPLTMPFTTNNKLRTFEILQNFLKLQIFTENF
jgi:hypothetical protein